jgi:hypothetical protein
MVSCCSVNLSSELSSPHYCSYMALCTYMLLHSESVVIEAEDILHIFKGFMLVHRLIYQRNRSKLRLNFLYVIKTNPMHYRIFSRNLRTLFLYFGR